MNTFIQLRTGIIIQYDELNEPNKSKIILSLRTIGSCNISFDNGFTWQTVNNFRYNINDEIASWKQESSF